ncbi:MAG: C1 family peptidase [Bacteroidota bacterium]|nr:C1 family peptidase [Bacteroidota bacterium]
MQRTINFLLIILISSLSVYSQPGNYKFSEIKKISATDVKSQGRTGTCWSFATTSFLESEIMRIKGIECDLSEMLTVRYSYKLRAEKYVRYHGYLNFGPGAEAWDVMDVISKYGIIPNKDYPGLLINKNKHIHSEMDAVLKSVVETIILNKNKELSSVWLNAFDGILDAYLGEVPNEFTYNGSKYSTFSFAKDMGINANNYIAITSFTHHPYYKEFVFESPDNWSNGVIQNVKLNELISIIDNAIDNGYTIAWASDVSDKGFRHSKGLAIVPDKNWSDMDEDEREKVFVEPCKQKEINAEMRQLAYNNYNTTDDHLMHIIGSAKDKNGTKYYLVKNSWGKERNELGGYFYASEAYVKLRTMSIMVHKDAVPVEILEKF